MMTEAIYPAVLHQDPRYFRRGTGGGWSRLGSAAGQIFWTHTDSDHARVNFSEIVGNSTAVAISTAYYPDNRTAGNAVSKLVVQLGVDVAANLLKEFWPDINRKFSAMAPAPREVKRDKKQSSFNPPPQAPTTRRANGTCSAESRCGFRNRRRKWWRKRIAQRNCRKSAIPLRNRRSGAGVCNPSQSKAGTGP